MKRKASIAAALALAATLAAHAQTAPVTVEAPWVRATVQGQPTSGAYMTLTAREPLTLVSASTPVAGMAEVHEMKMEGDVMRMGHVETLALGPGRPLELKPGGYHIMLMQLRTRLQPPASVPVTLVFRNAAGQTSTVQVAAPVLVAPPRH